MSLLPEPTVPSHLLMYRRVYSRTDTTPTVKAMAMLLMVMKETFPLVSGLV
jgi:hypothetical protein